MNTYIITGCSSGIGLAVTSACLQQGDTIIGLARSASKTMPKHPNFHAIDCDLSKLSRLEQTLKTLARDIPTLDGIISAAGVGLFKSIEQYSLSQIEQLVNVNFLSAVVLIKHFLPQLKRQARGKIILIGSECALAGHKNASIYAASKFALRGFSQSLREECQAKRIAVSLINPGLVDTPFYDHLTFTPGDNTTHAITAEQVAKVVLDCLECASNFVLEEINLQSINPQIKVK